jgi:hypothetical protein
LQFEQRNVSANSSDELQTPQSVIDSSSSSPKASRVGLILLVIGLLLCCLAPASLYLLRVRRRRQQLRKKQFESSLQGDNVDITEEYSNRATAEETEDMFAEENVDIEIGSMNENDVDMHGDENVDVEMGNTNENGVENVEGVYVKQKTTFTSFREGLHANRNVGNVRNLQLAAAAAPPSLS